MYAVVFLRRDPDNSLSPLMILGTPVGNMVFNVIAGASAFLNDLREVAGSFRVHGRGWWRKVTRPGLSSYYITGAITASKVPETPASSPGWRPGRHEMRSADAPWPNIWRLLRCVPPT